MEIEIKGFNIHSPLLSFTVFYFVEKHTHWVFSISLNQSTNDYT